PRLSSSSQTPHPASLLTSHWPSSSCVTNPTYRRFSLAPLDRSRRYRDPIAGPQYKLPAHAGNGSLATLIVQGLTFHDTFDSLSADRNAICSGNKLRRRTKKQAHIHLSRVIAAAESSFGGDGFSIARTIEGFEFHGNRNRLIAID